MLTKSTSQSASAKNAPLHLEYRLLWAMTFPLFLIAAIVGRLVPHRGQPRHGIRDYVSVISKAKEMADCALPFVYMT